MDMNKLIEAQKQLESIREYCGQNSHMTYDEMENAIEGRVAKLQEYFRDSNIPLVVNLYSIVSEFCAEDSYEEEEYSSSYYEEEEYSSSYYEED
ncbi:hypothetical protein ABE137_12095 [Brevibacillus laterosporus]|uniref:hypothetical protein n=1 Tax=Brevibacillus phage Sundance TaxID=1691958 RepID=UPI0006BC4C68|nr:hypothetical protein AVT09_gp088 [Brevibacillus phage Sundance]ALA47904.1 hypothetical protein SUNDANCE_88 [Brevibacillus phage Sundance]